MDKAKISKDDFIKLVKQFLKEVDGGCFYCAEDATRCLMIVFEGDFDWKELFKKIQDERW